MLIPRLVYYEVYPIDLMKDRTGVSWALAEQNSLLHTLATSSRKASLVKTLHVQFEYTEPYEVALALRPILVRLAEGLQNMPSLVDLRVMYRNLPDPSEGGLGQAIKHQHFRLHTLYLDHSHDLEGIIASQPELRLLGIYHIHFDRDALAKVKGLYHNIISCRHLSATPTPTMFLLDGSWSNSQIYAVTMLPAFYQSGQVAKACGEIASSLGNEDPGHLYEENKSRLSISLIGISAENIGLVSETMEAMATRFPNSSQVLKVSVVDTSIQAPWRVPDFVQHLVLFEYVKVIFFFFPNLEDAQFSPLSEDLHLALMADLGRVWPKVQQVTIRSPTQRRGFQHPDWLPPISEVAYDTTDEEDDDSDEYDDHSYYGYDSYEEYYGYDSDYDDDDDYDDDGDNDDGDNEDEGKDVDKDKSKSEHEVKVEAENVEGS
ncbi:hypothetical protein APHAL10511_003385 [Amanita phalloides]|nr:hypothetical protein APHAL10511_003385 [Amanita phalloides]